MTTTVNLERFDWPIVKAEPSGFDFVTILIGEPSCLTNISATIPVKSARAFAEKLLALCQALEKGAKP